MSAPTPPWEAEAIEAFAVGSTRDFDRNPAVWQTSMPPKVESRALGATSLVLALFPVAFVFVFYLIGMIVSFQPDAGFLAGIGQIIIGFIGGVELPPVRRGYDGWANGARAVRSCGSPRTSPLIPEPCSRRGRTDTCVSSRSEQAQRPSWPASARVWTSEARSS